MTPWLCVLLLWTCPIPVWCACPKTVDDGECVTNQWSWNNILGGGWTEWNTGCIHDSTFDRYWCATQTDADDRVQSITWTGWCTTECVDGNLRR